MYAAQEVHAETLAELKQYTVQELRKISQALMAVQSGQAYPHSVNLSKRQYWDDLVAGFNSGKVGASNAPTWDVLRNGISAYSFSASAMNEMWISPIHLDHTIRPNMPIYPHIHWTTAGTNTGVVRWGIEYTIAKGHQQEAFPTTQTIYLEQAASGTAYKHMICEATDAQAITASIETDALLMIRVFRDAAHANDTCTDKAFGLMCDIHYLKGYWATKNKSPNFYE
jgi:hypothetical protein